MAKCDLLIELDDPQRVHDGGGTISGVVRVRADADVNCNGLEVKSVWRTHGRGNVAKGEVGAVTLFEGQWRNGEENEYRFELPVANWPPTYHGFHLNVDHYIDARAKVPWSFDPKASVAFPMRPTGGAEIVTVDPAVRLQGKAAKIIGVGVVTMFMAFSLVITSKIGPLALLFLIVPLAGGIFWFAKFVLPKWALGDVDCRLDSETFVPGEQVTGELIIRPRKHVAINGIALEFLAREQCVSGSGSNRTTHKHVFFEQSHSLCESTTLSPGQEHRFPIQVQLPDDAPYSVDLSDNDLIWSTKLRVDIPRWPDWVKEVSLRVVPSGKSLPPATSAPTITTSAPSPEGGITFEETARHLWSVRDDRQQVEMLAEAVSGLTFEFAARIERRLLYAGDDDPHVYRDGFAVWARYPDPALPLVLYVPHHLGDEFEQAGRELWRGRGTIVGWDSRHGRLQIKL